MIDESAVRSGEKREKEGAKGRDHGSPLNIGGRRDCIGTEKKEQERERGAVSSSGE